MDFKRSKAAPLDEAAIMRNEKIWTTTMVGVAVVMLLAIMYVSFVLHGTSSTTFETLDPLSKRFGQELGASVATSL